METQQFSPSEHSKLPHLPGVYKFFNTDQLIIYVGKAKDLSKRVGSYFTKISDVNRKTQRLIKEIHHIEIVIVNSEFDALLLENSLIKEHQPKYNILLKDDKSFPSILVTNERFPRIYATRNINPELGSYYGPFTSVKAMNALLELLRKLYKIRTCSFNLSEQNIKKEKFKICLEYHIGNCLGPCEGLQSEDQYLIEIKSAIQILKGNINIIRSEFKDLMIKAANELQFETAQAYKSKFDLLDNFQSKSLIVSPNNNAIDVVGVIKADPKYYVNYLKIEHGSIRVSETVEATRKLEEPEEELLQIIAFNLRKKYNSFNKEILTNKKIEHWDDILITEPKIGDKRKLLDLSLKNARYFKQEKDRQNLSKLSPSQRILEQLQSDLSLKSIPVHIECFDNSNIQGTNPVSSMVCFKNGKPSKKDYRRYNIKTVEGPNDFASMKEVVGRRYRKLKNENLKFPNLIIVDGGKGQLSSATEALKELGLYGKIPIIGIAKRLEEIYFPEDSIPVHINKKSLSLKLLQHLRDEAHRFAISFHRTKRSKAATHSELDKIKGIGKSTKEKLLRTFKSVKRIQIASKTELEATVGVYKASIILEAFQKKRSTN